MKHQLVSETAPEAIGPYSQAIAIDLRACERVVYVSGQIPIDRSTGLIPEGIDAQTQQVLKNIEAVLASDNLSMSNVVKTTVLLQDMNDFAKMNAIYSASFSAPYPARAAFEVARLPKDVLVEIEAIAYA